MYNVCRIFFLCFIFILTINIKINGEILLNQSQNIIKPTLALKEPILDGSLNDEIWQRKPDVDGKWITYSPENGNEFPQKTYVWLAYDLENLYFAFYCFDDEAHKIKTSVTKHDNMWGDDWIGFNIDTIGNKRYGYVLCANPNGIQGDLYDSLSTGVDSAPDYVWYSVGKIVRDGYIVEMKLPLSSIKYKSGKDVDMNIIFERSVNRKSVMGSWPQRPPGQPFFAGMARIVYGELKSQPRLEAIPSVTNSNFWDRENPEKWSKSNGITELGITAKYTITSSIVGEATLNPDFSQVETDAFQILVNQRYPIFYSEKRPFFMEASKRFSIAGSGMSDKNLIKAVHTRKIVEPGWGLKLGGEMKDLSFGFLVANDEWPGRTIANSNEEGVENTFKGNKANYIIGRTKVSLGNGNHVGALFVNRKFADGYNRALGGDIYYRFGGGNHFLKSHYIYTDTKDENTLEKKSGGAFTLAYEYLTKAFELKTSYENFDENFNMSTAFLRRKGFSKGTMSLGVNFYPKSKELWLKRISPFVLGYYLNDSVTDEKDYLIKGGVKFNFIKQGSIKFEFQSFSEFWTNQSFKGNFWDINAGIQLTNWLNLNSYIQVGDSIYYDPFNPLLGNGFWLDLQATIQPNSKLTQFFQYQYQKLNHKDLNNELYKVNIFISHTTYQLNRYLFLRAIFQYDSYLETLLTDALLSFELIPGTVLQLGYGSFYERQQWIDNKWIDNGPLRHLYQKNQSLFFKASYLFRF